MIKIIILILLIEKSFTFISKRKKKDISEKDLDIDEVTEDGILNLNEENFDRLFL